MYFANIEAKEKLDSHFKQEEMKGEHENRNK